MPLSPHTIVDAVYEAVAFPDRWPSVMDQVASFAGAAGGSVHLTDGASSMRRASERLEGLMASWFEEGWHRHTFWHQRAVNFRRQSFYDVLDLCSAEEL